MTSTTARALALVLLLPLAALLWAWPLPVLPMIAGLAAYAALLLWRPWLWMVILPASVPLLDLTPWSGWMLLGEPDLLFLVTMAVLLWRERPVMPRLSPLGRWAVLGLTLATLIAVGMGFTQPEPPGGADLIYMTAMSGLRLAKPWCEALLLLPILAAHRRTQAGIDWLLGGAALLGGGVALLVGLERVAFVDLFDFASDYRVVGPFSSMHVGGGHIGAALALALGGVVAGFSTRLRWWMLGVLLPVLYALAVTYARAAYAAGLVAAVVAGAASLLSAWKPGLDPRRLLPLAVAVFVAGLVGVAALDTPLMSGRFTTLAGDLETREGNWRHGLALHQGGALGWLFGEGLGSFPRIAAVSAAQAGNAKDGPSYWRLLPDPALELVSRTPLYLGHRVDGVAPGDTLSLSLRYRVHMTDKRALPEVASAGGVGAILCEKWLLYSLACNSAGFGADAAGAWQTGTATLVVPGEPGRLIELSLTTAAGGVVDLADLHLRRADGTELLANGDFHSGTQRWFFTDDNHLVWRMKDQFLMSLFETGLFGLLAWLALILAAALGSLRALLRGEAGIAAGVAAVTGARPQ